MNPFKVGQKITWTHQAQSGSTLKLSTREGTVAEVSEHACRVRKRNGQLEWINHTRLRDANQKNGVTEFFEALAKAVTKDAEAAR